MKRLFSVFLAAALLMALAVPASAAESYIWDEAGLLTEEGRAELNETAREISESRAWLPLRLALRQPP